jgi:hypothetical protein
MSSAAAAVSEPDVFTQNPYAGRADLSEPEALLLWEYAQTAQLVRDVRPASAPARAPRPE